MKRKAAGIAGWENTIAGQRIEKLIGLATAAYAEGDSVHARRYVTIARKIAMRHRLKIGSGLFCKSCNQIFAQAGKTHKVRIVAGKPFCVCASCGKKRMPPAIRRKVGSKRTETVRK